MNQDINIGPRGNLRPPSELISHRQDLDAGFGKLDNHLETVDDVFGGITSGCATVDSFDDDILKALFEL